MPKPIRPQSLDDILNVIESAQQQGRRLQIKGDRVEMATRALGRSIFRRTESAVTEVASRAVAQAIRTAILNRLERETPGWAAGVPSSAHRALRLAVVQLHRDCGPNELPVARYRTLLSEFTASSARSGFGAASAVAGSVTEPRLSFDPVAAGGVDSLLAQVGPGGNTLRVLLADYEHELGHRLFPSVGEDRPQACARLMNTLSRLMDRLERLSAQDADTTLPGRQQAIEALQEGVETEVRLIAHALTLSNQPREDRTWRTALNAARQEMLGLASPPTTRPESGFALAPGQRIRAQMEDVLATQALRHSADGDGPLSSAGVDGGSRPVGDPGPTPWGSLIAIACATGRAQTPSTATPLLGPGAAQPPVVPEAAKRASDEGAEFLRAAEQSLRSFASEECRRLCMAGDDGDPDRAAALTARVDALAGDVVSSHLKAPDLLLAMAPGDGSPGMSDKERGYRTQRALLEAQYALRAGLQALHSEWLGDAGVARSAQVTVFADGPLGPPRYALLQPAPPVENLVLGGGGMKSTGISAALTEYAQAGLLSGVKKIAGNSAGAITGGILACGWPLGDLALLNAQMSNFASVFQSLDNGHELTSLYPGLTLGNAAVSHAGRLVRAMDFQTATAVQSWIQSHEDDLRRAMRSRRVSMAEVQQLDRLRRQDLSGVNREPQMVTFRDLDVLHRIAPDQFKQLAVTAYDAQEHADHTFDVTTHPDLPIAYAARASMAAPVAFTAVEIEGRRYLDGGFSSNVPVDVIHRDQHGAALDHSRATTMLLAYESLGETSQSLYQPEPDSGRGKALTDLVFRVLGQADHSEAELADRRRLRDTGPQTTVVYHGDLSTFDFAAEPERVAFAVAHSRLMAQEQVAQRQHQAYHTVYDRPEDVLQALDATGRQQVLKDLKRLEQLTQGLEDPLITARQALLKALTQTADTSKQETVE